MIPDVQKTPFGEDGWQEFAAFLRQHEQLILYHGTSSAYLASILEKGILPREQHGNSTYRNQSTLEGKSLESRKGLVYLIHAAGIGFGGNRAAHASGGSCVGLRVLLNTAALVPDEDSRKQTWWESIAWEDSCAAVGPILPQQILGVVNYTTHTYAAVRRSPPGYVPTFARRRWLDVPNTARNYPRWYGASRLKRDALVV